MRRRNRERENSLKEKYRGLRNPTHTYTPIKISYPVIINNDENDNSGLVVFIVLSSKIVFLATIVVMTKLIHDIE